MGERREVLHKVLEHCGIDNSEALESTAESWARENPTPDNRFAEIYPDRDWGLLKSLLRLTV